MSLRLGPRPGVRLRGTGAASPADLPGAGPGRVLTNAAVYERLLGPDFRAELDRRGWTVDHPERRHGIRTRQWVAGESSEDLAALAARRALDDAALAPAELDVLLVATSTPGRITRSAASAVGGALGLGCPCLDVRAGGSGGLYAWLDALGWLALGARTALVVAAETPSRYLDPADLATAVVYGDAAGALVLERGDPGSGPPPGLLGAVLGNALLPGRPFTVPGPLPPEVGPSYTFQRPDAPYAEGLAREWRATCRRLREAFPAPCEAVGSFVPYAVTRGQVEAAAGAFGAGDGRTVDELEERGCTGSAGPLAALHAARSRGRATAGETLALVSVAGGVAWVGMLWRM